MLTIPANYRPHDAPPGFTGLPVDSYVPRCECGWAGPLTMQRETAALNERLHLDSCQSSMLTLF